MKVQMFKGLSVVNTLAPVTHSQLVVDAILQRGAEKCNIEKIPLKYLIIFKKKILQNLTKSKHAFS